MATVQAAREFTLSKAGARCRPFASPGLPSNIDDRKPMLKLQVRKTHDTPVISCG